MNARIGSKKGQSVVEYLSSYVWALLIMAIALIVLYSFGFFTPQQPTQKSGACEVLRPHGPNSTDFLSLVGLCSTLSYQYVAVFRQDNNGFISITPPKRSFNQFSLSLWFKSDNTGTTPQNVAYVSGPSGGIWIYWSPNLPATASTWNFAILTGDYQTGVYNLYVNNALVSTGSAGDTPANSINIGGAIPDQGLSGFSGKISNVQLYNATLTQTQMQRMFAAGSGGLPPVLKSLVGWWQLNGDVNDYSGEANPGLPMDITFSGT